MGSVLETLKKFAYNIREMKKTYPHVLYFPVLAALTAFSPAAAPLASAQSGDREPAIDFSGFDESIEPGDDFFKFVNGKWIEETPIPSDKSRWGSFVILAEKSRDAILEIISELSESEDLENGSDEQQIRDLYQSYMDKDRIDQLGYSPIESELHAIDSIRSMDELASIWADASRSGVASPIDLWISQDAKDSTKYIVYMTQSGLGLPDRDFYLESDDRSVDIQKAYKDFLTRIFEMTGHTDAAAKAASVYDLEKKLAEIQWSRVDNRDRIKTYNKKSLGELASMAPQFQWTEYFKGNGIENEKEVIIRQPEYIEKLNAIISGTPLETWKEYLKARVLTDAAPYLSSDFFDTHFNFYSRTLSGQEEPEQRNKRATSLVNGILGEVIGKVYVKRHFPPEAKQRMNELVANLKVAMRQSLNTLEWMDDTTKSKALDKLAKFTTKIGYPDKWKDYSKLSVLPDDLLGNIRRASELSHQREVAKLGGPIDRDEWFMTPQTVNAYYNPMLNEIVFPAAILQPPFFNLHADDAVNYGAIGMVIGHEIGHGFDDQGRKSDGDGNLVEWWSKDSAEAYEGLAARIVAQYNEFEPLEGFKVNGQLTLGENIGDLGGLTLAWRALQNALKDKNQTMIDGYSPQQRFFLSFAQIWRVKQTTELTIRRLKTDTHSPPEFRVNGPLMNFTPFFEAFGVEEENRMWTNPSARVSIW